VAGVAGGKGYFVPPTVLADVPADSRAWREEVFGPVLCLRDFRTEEEAVATANDSAYGLAAAVMSADAALCDRVARRLRVGVVWLNCSQPAFVQAPWGGVKQSGFGRDLGRWGLDECLVVKQVTACASGFSWGLW
jgi:betaine-aldehyde dehydrogenase